MRPSRFIFLTGIGIILLYSGWLFIAPKMFNPRYAPSTPMALFARGTWRMQKPGTDARGAYVQISQVDFAAPATLVYDQWRVYSDASRIIYFYNLKMGYQFTSETQVRLTGRSIENWHLARDGTILSINTADSIVPTGRYSRLETPDWRIFALGLGILMAASLCIWPVSMGPNGNKAITIFPDANQLTLRAVYQLMLRCLVLLLLIGIGIFIGRYLSEQWRFLFIRLPWDFIVLLEISITLLIIGVHFGISLIVDDLPSRLVARKWVDYLGALLGGVGFWGILVGLFYLALFFVAGGSYGAGA